MQVTLVTCIAVKSRHNELNDIQNSFVAETNTLTYQHSALFCALIKNH